MKENLVKFYSRWKHLLSAKGQGLVEFALILAFCAIIGYAVSEMGFIEALRGVFHTGDTAYLTAEIGGGKKPSSESSGGETGGGDNNGGGGSTDDHSTSDVSLSVFDWGKLDPNTYFEQPYKDEKASLDGGKTYVNFKTAEASQANRLAADQKALENIARHFIGMTKSDVENLMTGPTARKKDSNGNYIIENGAYKYIDCRAGEMLVDNRQELLLGHFVPGENGKGMKFLADAKLGESEAENIFKWMKNPDDPDSVEYDPTYMYFVSDYAVSQDWIDGLNAGSMQKNGLRIQLEYDYSDKDSPFANKNSVKVIGVNIALDPRSQDNEAIENGGTKNKNGTYSTYNRKSSAGLNVQVRTDSNGELYVTHEDTGRISRLVNNNLQIVEYNDEGDLVVDTNSGTDSMYRWFRDGDDKVVKKYFVDNSTHISNPENLAAEVTKKFEVGDIIQLCNEKIENGVVKGYEYKYYVALNSGTFTVSNDQIGTLGNNFVQIGKYQNGNYYHDNQTPTRQLKDSKFPKYQMRKGDLMITDKGEIYMYVGSKDKMPYAGIDDTNYILLNGKNQGASGGSTITGTTFAEKKESLERILESKVVTQGTQESYKLGAIVKENGINKIVYNTDGSNWNNVVEYHIIDAEAAMAATGSKYINVQSGDIIIADDGNAYFNTSGWGGTEYPNALYEPRDHWVKIDL